MSFARPFERALERLFLALAGDRVSDPAALVRFVEFGIVGVSGMVIDTSTVFVLNSAGIHYLPATVAAFSVAVTWNFYWNWRITFDRPGGSRLRQYGRYVGVHISSFAVRVAVVVLLVEFAGFAVIPGTMVAILFAGVFGFLGNEHLVFNGDGLPQDSMSTGLVNSVVHRLASEDMKDALRRLGLYNPLFTAYEATLTVIHPHDVHEVTVGGASAKFRTAQPPETLSILHTVQKESDVLEAFVRDLRRRDVVLDVGANLGVYTILAAKITGTPPIAIEPHKPTEKRLRENAELNHVDVDSWALALGDPGEGRTVDAILMTERDELGTQTGRLRPFNAFDDGGQDGEYRVLLGPGDDFLKVPGLPDPTVIKIDVEGAELEVLRGLEETLGAGVRLIYCETHDDHTTEMAEKALQHQGYETQIIKRTGPQRYIRAVLA